jgi:hypothetical protein
VEIDRGVRGYRVRKYGIFLHKIIDSPDLLFTPFYIKKFVILLDSSE